MREPLFPTTVIGSLPRPAWVADIILDRKEGRLSKAARRLREKY
jgi:methionine synthase II (cobalamin-independent)